MPTPPLPQPPSPGSHRRSGAPGCVAGDGARSTRGIHAQGQKPVGRLGWVVAVVMTVVFVPINARVARLLEPRTEDAVLDVACGAGVFLRRHASHARRVAGIDHSPAQITLARRLLHGRLARGTAEVVEGDAAALPWPDAEFTAVTCNCLDCFEQPARSLAEMRRVLRPGGRMVVGIDTFDNPTAARRFERKSGLHAWTPREFGALLAQAGFEDVTMAPLGGRTYARAVRP
jgi:ubiquinone/menaquinone biosynthesis C-methylase UbiE